MLRTACALALGLSIATPNLVLAQEAPPQPAPGDPVEAGAAEPQGDTAQGQAPAAEAAAAPGQDNCPSDAFYCDEGFSEGAAPADQAGSVPPAASGPEPAAAGREPGQVVVDPRADGPERRVRVDRGPRPPPPRARQRLRRWGLNVRLNRALIDGRQRGADPDADMGGAGVALHYRPTRRAAFSLSLDALSGTDFNGDHREEGVLSPNALIYLNPRDRAQVYLLVGLHFAGADVEVQLGDGSIEKREYSYFGAQIGVGLEFRLAPWVGLDTTLLAFVRGRTDDTARDTPEFVDAVTGRATNESGGGLFRLGATFYW